MLREEIRNKVRNIIADLWCIEDSSIDDNSNFVNDLQADSLDAVEVIMRTEDEFDIDITNEEADLIITPNALINFIEKKIKLV